MDTYNHEQQVEAFLQSCREEDEDHYKQVCDKYPVQTRERTRLVRKREITVGLLGLSPSRISLGTATRNDLESIYQDEGRE